MYSDRRFLRERAASAKEARMMDDSKYQSNRTEILFLARPSRAVPDPYFTTAMRRIYHPIKIDSRAQIARCLRRSCTTAGETAFRARFANERWVSVWVRASDMCV